MSIAATVGAVTSVLSMINSAKNKDIKGMVDEYNKLNKNGALLRTNGSMTKLLSSFIISPVAIVDNTLKNEEVIDKVLELNTNIFSGYFAQTFDILVKVQGYDHRTVLNLLSSDNVVLGREELDYVGQLLDSGSEILSISVEGKSDKKRRKRARDDKNTEASNSYRNKTTKMIDNDKINSIIENRLDIEILLTTDGVKHVIVIPMVIKTNVMYVSPQHILGVMETRSDDKRFGARVDEYRAGAISLSDLLFGNDLIKEYKDGKIKDNNALLDIVNKRTINANTKMLTDGGVGFERYFNLLIISNYTKSMLENAVKGSLNKTKYKEKILENTASLLCTVVDTDYERVVIYTKDIDGVSDVTFKALSKGGKDNSELTAILKSLLNNTPPSF